MKMLFILSLLASTATFASIEQDITEGKITATESIWLKELEANVNEKQQKALALITLVGQFANNNNRDAEYAHVGFVARLQGIREDRESLAKAGQFADYAALQNYSKRLDSLIADLRVFIK